jgi:hypothetical protein
MTIEQWYDNLTEKPLTINGLIYTFLKPSSGSDLSDLEIDDTNKRRIMLSDYLLEETDGKLTIRLKYVNSSRDRKILVDDSMKTEVIGQYIYLSKDDFERVVTDQLFLVEEY